MLNAASWEKQYQVDFEKQRTSGPVVFTDEQRQKNLELRDAVRHLLPIDDAYKLHDCDLLYRFLIGRRWDVPVAAAFIEEYVKIRVERRLNGIIGRQLDPKVESMMGCMYGFDRDGFPLLWYTPDPIQLLSMVKGSEKDSLIEVQMQLMEKARYIAKQRGVERCSYVINLAKITMSSVNSLMLGFLREMSKMLQEYYPEVMHRLLVFNTGWAVSGAWKVLKPFIDVRVQEKVRFFSGDARPENLTEFMTREDILPEMGGNNDEDIVGDMLRCERKRLQEFQSNPICVDEHENPHEAEGTTDVVAMPEIECVGEHSGLFSVRSSLSLDGLCGAGDDSVHILIGSTTVVDKYCYQSMPMKDRPLHKDPTNDVLFLCGENDDNYSSSCRDTQGSDGCSGDLLLSLCESTGSGVDVAAGRSHTGFDEREPYVEICLEQRDAKEIVGHYGGVCVGRLTFDRVYTFGGATDNIHALSVPNNGLGLESCIANACRPSLMSSSSTPIIQETEPTQLQYISGELLREAGHPVHDVTIVCNSHRHARFVLRKSRVRRRIIVYQIVGNALVHTDGALRHTINGKRVKMGEVLPIMGSKNKDEWVLYGDDAGASTKTGNFTRWRKSLKGVLRGPESANTGVLAERRGQHVRCYGCLANGSPSLLFTFVASITQTWAATEST